MVTESKPAAAITSAVHGLGMVSQALVALRPAVQMDLKFILHHRMVPGNVRR